MRLVTVGAYGFTERSFFDALGGAGVDVFCDLRQRRGMRGRAYSFANSAALQSRLSERGIRYVYLKELAPTKEVRRAQKEADARVGQTKSQRAALAPEFVEAYERVVLSQTASSEVLTHIGNANVVALFCVERPPNACHRSLVARWLAGITGAEVVDLLP